MVAYFYISLKPKIRSFMSILRIAIVTTWKVLIGTDLYLIQTQPLA